MQDKGLDKFSDISTFGNLAAKCNPLSWCLAWKVTDVIFKYYDNVLAAKLMTNKSWKKRDNGDQSAGDSGDLVIDTQTTGYRQALQAANDEASKAVLNIIYGIGQIMAMESLLYQNTNARWGIQVKSFEKYGAPVFSIVTKEDEATKLSLTAAQETVAAAWFALKADYVKYVTGKVPSNFPDANGFSVVLIVNNYLSAVAYPPKASEDWSKTSAQAALAKASSKAAAFKDHFFKLTQTYRNAVAALEAMAKSLASVAINNQADIKKSAPLPDDFPVTPLLDLLDWAGPAGEKVKSVAVPLDSGFGSALTTDARAAAQVDAATVIYLSELRSKVNSTIAKHGDTLVTSTTTTSSVLKKYRSAMDYMVGNSFVPGTPDWNYINSFKFTPYRALASVASQEYWPLRYITQALEELM
jgi:hypothetical protein